jgi:hypothetical protein
MIRRTTWIVLVLLGALVLLAWFVQRSQARQTAGTATITPIATAENVFDLSNMTISEIIISNKNGKSVDFLYDSASTIWTIKDIPADQADSSQIESISKELNSLQVMESLLVNPPLDSIGLANPEYTITIRTAEGKQIVVYIGSLSAIETGYYIQVDSGPIMIVDKFIMDDVIKLLTEPPLIETATPDVTGTLIAPESINTPTP